MTSAELHRALEIRDMFGGLDGYDDMHATLAVVAARPRPRNLAAERAWRRLNRTHVLEREPAYRARNRERLNQHMREYVARRKREDEVYAAHRIEQTRRWREANRERKRQLDRESYHRHRDERNARRRARTAARSAP